MSPKNPYRKPVSSQVEKVEWLLKHQDLWVGFPSGDGVFNWSDPRYKEIVDKMKKDGLVSQRTIYADVNLHKLINIAKKIRRDGKSWTMNS